MRWRQKGANLFRCNSGGFIGFFSKSDVASGRGKPFITGTTSYIYKVICLRAARLAKLSNISWL